MEDLSYHYSPKARDFITTQTTNMTTARSVSDCNLCPRTASYQKEDLTVTDLKREYSKALNCIEILKLEKKNLHDALTITKDFKRDKTEKFFVSSTRCTTAAASPKADFRSPKSGGADRKVIELEQELLEQGRLLNRSEALNEQLKRENFSYRERLQEVDNLELHNHQLKNDIKELTEELRRESRRVYELEDEKDQLLDRRTQLTNSSKKLPPRDLYRYLDHVYELIGSLNRNHYAHYHFRECFVDEGNIETLIEEKETNQLLVQSFRYITNLLMNINSSNVASVEQRRASRTLLTDSGSENQQRFDRRENALGNSSQVQYTEQEEGDMYPPNPTPNTNNVSRNLNLNAVSRDIDAQPHSFGETNPLPLSHQDLSPEHNGPNSYTKVYSPSNSRNVISSSYSNKPNTEAISTKKDLSRQTSYKSGISISPNNRRDRSPSSKHVSEANATGVMSKQSLGRSHVSQRPLNQTAEGNALNVSKHSQGRSHISLRTNHQTADANGLNVSRQSQAKSHVSHHTVHQQNTEVNGLNVSKHSQGKSYVSHHTVHQQNPEVNGLNVSRHSQGKSYVSHHTTHQNADGDYYMDKSGNVRNMTHDLEDREMRLRDLDRELQEKDRLLQMKEKEIKDRSVMEKSMSRFRAQEETEVNRSALSQSRKLASQKSIRKDKSTLQSKQRLDESRENTRVLKSQTQLKGQSHVEYERANTNLNRSNSNIQSRIIPSITSLNDMDASPKMFGASPKHTQTQIKSMNRLAGSVQSIEGQNDFQRSPKTFTTNNSQKFLAAASVYDQADASGFRLGGQQRVPYQEAYLGVQSFENSPQSKISPKPQILERLENSGIKFIDQGSRNDYENSQIYESHQNIPYDMGSPKSENTKRHITFDVRNLGDIEEIESSPHSKSHSRKMSLGESAKKGTEYASFRVSFGRTQSKYAMRDQSPADIDSKDSLYIVDVARRKRITHPEQTYDVVQGNEVRYDLQSMGSEYSVTKSKPRNKYAPQSQNQSEYLDRSPQMNSPAPASARAEK